MARVIICATPFYGHVAPMRTIAADLVARGHDVTFLTGSAFRESVERTGAAFAPLGGRADFDLATVDSTERDALEPGPAMIEWDMRHVFVGPLADQYLALRRLLDEAGSEPVIVLSETMFMGTAPFQLGAPGPKPTAVVGIGVLSFGLMSEDVAPFGMGLPPDSSEEGRERNRAANAFMREQMLGTPQREYEAMLAELGVTGEIPYFLDALILETDRFLQLSIEELSYHRTDTPDHVEFVGRVPSVVPAGTALPAWWDEVLAAENVVVVTQGTLANKDLSALIEPTLAALADLPVLVLAAIGRDVEGELRDVPANVRVAEFVPFDDLLPHANVLVTNGGFGAVQQSLSHGTPLVLAGQTEDKLENNVRTAATGAAINLATDNPAPEDIRKAVEAVLTSPDYRRNAERLAQEYAKFDALDAVARTVDEFAAVAGTTAGAVAGA